MHLEEIVEILKEDIQDIDLAAVKVNIQLTIFFLLRVAIFRREAGKAWCPRLAVMYVSARVINFWRICRVVYTSKEKLSQNLFVQMRL